jgi:aspartate/methionine/tyrosine aminotransferase
MSTAEALNAQLEREAPAVAAALSPLGRRAFYPPDIPFQAAQARGKTYNATIGQITDGNGRILALPTITAVLDRLNDADRNRALLYSPIEGLAELRERWQRWQTPAAESLPSGALPAASVPIVTCGLAHALALTADVFAGPGRKVFIPAPFWGNYRQIYGIRTGAEVVAVPCFPERRFDPLALARAIASLPSGTPAMALLNIPANPTGYSPTTAERGALVASLFEEAERRPIVVVCDDAYAGLVYEDGIPTTSLFWELAGRSGNLIPLLVTGSTKELVFFGGRVGFLTLPWASDSPVTSALEGKIKGLIRAGIGSPPALSQMVLLQALRKDDIREEIAVVVAVMKERCRVLRAELERAEREHGAFRVLPFNSGVFALVELPEGIDADTLRRHLLEHEDVGLVSIGERYLRVAFCSLEAEAVPELVKRLVRGVGVVGGVGVAQ